MKHSLGSRFESVILSSTGAGSLESLGVIQDLWSGYGKILRLRLHGGAASTVVVKHVRMPSAARHPRGWNSSESHDRKVKSYQVEIAWYRDWAGRCGNDCRIPRLIACASEGDEVLLVLEDLDAAGFPVRKRWVGRRQLELGLRWLADFHATFMGAEPVGLWETGTYWHLETRAGELEALEDSALKEAAGAIDLRLKQAVYQTLVHGDAKLANFCFSDSEERVAAVDFQYVGAGCGVKDVAYFIGSCLDEDECEKQESALLDCYFSALARALAEKHPEVDAAEAEAEWRGLYALAWTDFHRFLKGWSPGHWKIHGYSERLAREVLERI